MLFSANLNLFLKKLFALSVPTPAHHSLLFFEFFQIMLLFTYWWCSNAPRFYDTLPPSMEITEVNFAETFFPRLSLNFLKMVVNGTKVFLNFCMKQNVRKVKKSKEEEEEIHSLVEKLWIPRALNFEDKKIRSMLLVVYDFFVFLSIVYLDITCSSYEFSRNNINHFFLTPCCLLSILYQTIFSPVQNYLPHSIERQ